MERRILIPIDPKTGKERKPGSDEPCPICGERLGFLLFLDSITKPKSALTAVRAKALDSCSVSLTRSNKKH